MHPLTPDLSKLSDDEFHTKRAEIQTRMNYAYQIGNGDMVGQLQLLAQDYMFEMERRNQKMMADAQKSGRLGLDTPAKDITQD